MCHRTLMFEVILLLAYCHVATIAYAADSGASGVCADGVASSVADVVVGVTGGYHDRESARKLAVDAAARAATVAIAAAGLGLKPQSRRWQQDSSHREGGHAVCLSLGQRPAPTATAPPAAMAATTPMLINRSTTQLCWQPAARRTQPYLADTPTDFGVVELAVTSACQPPPHAVMMWALAGPCPTCPALPHACCSPKACRLDRRGDLSRQWLMVARRVVEVTVQWLGGASPSAKEALGVKYAVPERRITTRMCDRHTNPPPTLKRASSTGGGGAPRAARFRCGFGLHMPGGRRLLERAKHVGRRTSPVFGGGINMPTSLRGNTSSPDKRFVDQSLRSRGSQPMRRPLSLLSTSVTDAMEAAQLWDLGYTGEGVHVAVFDTGLRRDHEAFREGCVVDRTNWTNERSLDDGVGHGTFVAGIVAGSPDCGCPGFAPDATLHVFRVFTNAQVSYTSWFLDAFNYALHLGVHVLNLSIGGPDFNDRPFVDKVWELTANGVIVVSAIGNDGNVYGTLNNPADQPDVLGVGGYNKDGSISDFSSRGMTTWQLPHGYGRVKPDVVAPADKLYGVRPTKGCHTMSGTSVAAPVVAGVVTLLASVVPERERWQLLNPASVKQLLLQGATRLVGANVFEQGAGAVNLLASYRALSEYQPHPSVFPATLDLTDCPYMWPYCDQPVFHTGMAAVINTTVLNPLAVASRIVSASWAQATAKQPPVLDVRFSHSEVIWPWTGHCSVSIEVTREGATLDGVIEGTITLVLETIPPTSAASVEVPVRVRVVPPPPRSVRILVDQFHSVRYPSGYVPRDDLEIKDDVLDWNGDHVHTNFRDMYTHLRSQGYYIDVLQSDWTCFDATRYGTLLVIDPEEEYLPAEVAKLQSDVREQGLSVLVLADWYNAKVIQAARFFDESTRSWWTPITGGANLPALNEALEGFGIQLGANVFAGTVTLGQRFSSLSTKFASGTSITRFPGADGSGYLSYHELSDQTAKLVGLSSAGTGWGGPQRVPVLGGVQLPQSSSGRIAVYGDSNCVDSAHSSGFCWWLLDRLLAFTAQGDRSDLFPDHLRLSDDFIDDEVGVPVRRLHSGLSRHSSVLRGHQAGTLCHPLDASLWWVPTARQSQSDAQSIRSRVFAPTNVPSHHESRAAALADAATTAPKLGDESLHGAAGESKSVPTSASAAGPIVPPSVAPTTGGRLRGA